VHEPAAVGDLAAGCARGFTAFSVLQYLDGSELHALLALAGEKLSTGGTLILGDVIPPGVGLRNDLREFLPRRLTMATVAERLWSAATLLASPYRSIRSRNALTIWSDEAMTSALNAAGFDAQRFPNIGHDPARVTWVGRKR